MRMVRIFVIFSNIVNFYSWFRVDKLSANIASQTEMLERVINMLPAMKEAESYDVARDSLEAKL